MKLEELNNEEFCVLVAPDGSPQLATLAPDYPYCLAMIQTLASSGMGQDIAELWKQGYQVVPVRLTLIADGTEEDAFNRFKEQNSDDNP